MPDAPADDNPSTDACRNGRCVNRALCAEALGGMGACLAGEHPAVPGRPRTAAEADAFGAVLRGRAARNAGPAVSGTAPSAHAREAARILHRRGRGDAAALAREIETGRLPLTAQQAELLHRSLQRFEQDLRAAERTARPFPGGPPFHY